MTSAIVLVAKLGDIIGFMAVAKHLNDTEGRKPLWVVHQTMLPVLWGASYVEAVPVKFGVNRVDMAMDLARSKVGEKGRVINGHTFGKSYKGSRAMAFNRLAWENNGFGHLFHDLAAAPLIFDRRDADREASLVLRHVKDARPLLLLNVAGGKSSPFSQHAVFADKIRLKWARRFQIVDLHGITATRIYDLCGLFDRAKLLITTDTFSLHLATASPGLKTICLVNDNPFLASEPRYQPLFLCRYADALWNIGKIHDAIVSIL